MTNINNLRDPGISLSVADIFQAHRGKRNIPVINIRLLELKERVYHEDPLESEGPFFSILDLNLSLGALPISC